MHSERDIVCPSHSGIVSKRMHVSSNSCHRLVDCSDILVLKLISVLVFILFSFFIVGEILQPSGGHMQGKGIDSVDR